MATVTTVTGATAVSAPRELAAWEGRIEGCIRRTQASRTCLPMAEARRSKTASTAQTVEAPGAGWVAWAMGGAAVEAMGAGVATTLEGASEVEVTVVAVAAVMEVEATVGAATRCMGCMHRSAGKCT